MGKIIFIVLLFLSSCITAQELRVQGHVLGDAKQDLESATVRCYTSDTIFVAGVTTNMKGLFTLRLPLKEQRYQLRFNYLGYKETTLTLYPTKESFVRLGDIRLDKQVEQLQEVTVMSSNEIRTEDRTMYYPTRTQLRHAYNGYSAIQILMIPGMEVGQSSITYTGREVLLCIDGRQATAEEVRDLNSNDIKRVDFYSQGRPDYPEADVLLDYILKEKDYIGSVATSAHHELNRPSGSLWGAVQYFEGKSEWAFSVMDGYKHHKTHPAATTETTYFFPNKTITRINNDLPSLYESNNLSSYINYIYTDKKQKFYTSIRMNRKRSADDDWLRQQYNNETDVLTKQEKRKSLDLNPALKLSYTRDLPRKQKIRVELYGSYGDNTYTRWYEQRKGEMPVSSYRNGTDEDSWYGNMTANYTKSFQNSSTLSFSVNQSLTYVEDMNTQQNEKSDLYMKRSTTRLTALYNYRIKNRLNLQLRLAENFYYTETNGHVVNTSTFIPALKLSYSHQNHSLQMEGAIEANPARLSSRTDHEYRLNEYEMFVGNPALKDYTKYMGNMRYQWYINPRWQLFASSQCEANSKSTYPFYHYDADRDLFTYQYHNGGLVLWWNTQVYGYYSVIPNRLRLRSNVIINYTKANLWHELSCTNMLWACSLDWMYKGWWIYAGAISSGKEMGFHGIRRKYPWKVNLNVQYSVNNLHVSLSSDLPLIGKNRSYLEQPEYNQETWRRVPRMDDWFVGLTLNYRFTFGKKKHQFDDSSVNDVNQSTISKE